jgi:serine/threonine-protein kinase RsbW
MSPEPDPACVEACFACVVAADPMAVRAGLARMASENPLSALDEDHRARVEVVLAEVLNNIAEHAYTSGEGSIAVTICQTRSGLQCLVTDDGSAMPDGRLPAGLHPAERLGMAETAMADLPMADLPEGGFGWFLIRRLTLDLHYAREGRCNRLSFVIPA